MRIVSYTTDRGPRVGLVTDDGQVLEAGTDPLAPAPPHTVAGHLDELALLPPVPHPSKIIAVGLNYRDHAAESGVEAPKNPLLFTKLPNALVGSAQDAVIPPVSSQLDYEAELAVILGRRTRRIGVDEALDAVFGYACLNDISARDLQFGDGQWVRGKSLDGSCPFGPYLVTADDVPDPQALDISCTVNGEVVQASTTKAMIFSVAQLISFISAHITLEPGDVIATGTPPGVGMARRPPLWLTDGDTVTVEITGLGQLTNRIVVA